MESARERWDTLEQLDDWLRIPMLALSLAWLIIVLVELTHGSTRLLAFFGSAIWIVFIAEFLLRLSLAPSRRTFIKKNWLTLVSLVVPALRLFRAVAILRAARALRGLRLVRIVGTANRSMNALKTTLHRRGLAYVIGLTLAVVALGAAGMFSFEPEAFESYGHALWWTAMLITSIGSDYWPHTIEGRVLSVILAVYGLAVFGYIAAAFASYFIGRDADASHTGIAGSAEIASLHRELALLRAELALNR
jgi:voltage-gated potassium channel